VFGADVITGFPTETVSAHAQNMAMIQMAGISYLHVFPYSPRPATPAAAMPQVDGATIKKRASDLRALGSVLLNHHLDEVIGMPDQLLIESGNVGHGKNFAKIRLDQPFVPASTLVDVKIYGRDKDVLLAHVA
jgi:threonylcarbamoyladenosine tRNA methylthiotransferase MtaB